MTCNICYYFIVITLISYLKSVCFNLCYIHIYLPNTNHNTRLKLTLFIHCKWNVFIVDDYYVYQPIMTTYKIMKN